MNAPIALFVYNRPDHTQQTLVSLQKNTLAKNSHLHIFSDGPKTEKDIPKITEVRKIVKNITGFKSVTVKERKSNFGLAKSIIEGVTEIINLHERVIVLEDDIVTASNFLSFMNTNLKFYENESNVACISGYVYPIDGLPDTFFLKGADCWGWATWKRAWKFFNPDGYELIEVLKNKNQIRSFNFNNNMAYFKMLKDQVKGKNDSWAVRWYASAFTKEMYCLYPGKSFVSNIGLDGSGTHCSISEDYQVNLSPNIIIEKMQIIQENQLAKKKFEFFFKRLKQNFFRKFFKSLKYYFEGNN